MSRAPAREGPGPKPQPSPMWIRSEAPVPTKLGADTVQKHTQSQCPGPRQDRTPSESDMIFNVSSDPELPLLGVQSLLVSLVGDRRLGYLAASCRPAHVCIFAHSSYLFPSS